RYLAEFLTDRRVIEWPRFYWYPILYGLVLNRRPQRVGKAYEAIWNRQENESFLRTYTRSQSDKLAARIVDASGRLVVDWAMRYGKPSIAEKILTLKEQGCDRILLFPLYPQYSASTTATVCDKTFDALKQLRWQPTLRVVPPYYDDPAYIEALASSVRSHVAGLGWEPQVILASFHGIPRSYADAGDPYDGHCRKTARLLRDALNLDEQTLVVSFQSRFGPAEWLKPYTDKTLAALPDRGVRRVAVVNPGFVSDCLETLEEIAVEGCRTFIQAGGDKFTHVPCLNDSAAGLDVIEAVVRRELGGWMELS
ncbi:MAG: ferrochelatase, partial [Hyphomicrobiaceae bacterium]